MPACLSKLVFAAILCLPVLAASASLADSAIPAESPGSSAAAAERLYLAAETTDSDEQATIGDPDEEATVGDPGEQAGIGDPVEEEGVGDPGQQERIGDPEEKDTVDDPDEKP